MRVSTAGVNPLDNMIVRGEVKLIVPYSFPLVMGNELAGVVEAVGANVTAFAPGDRVYGRLPLGKIGAFAELCAVDAGALAKIPDYLSFEEAAAVPLTALTAMQAFDLLDAKPGDTVFLSGGTGSLGAMAIPILKAKGLRVITSGSAKNRERVMALGVEQFIDYKTEGYYVLVNFQGEAELPKELERNLQISDSVIRYQVIKQIERKVGIKPRAVRPAPVAAPVAAPAVEAEPAAEAPVETPAAE